MKIWELIYLFNIWFRRAWYILRMYIDYRDRNDLLVIRLSVAYSTRFASPQPMSTRSKVTTAADDFQV